MVVIELQISLNLKSVPVGLVMYFGEGWMPKIVDKHKASQTATHPRLTECYRVV